MNHFTICSYQILDNLAVRNLVECLQYTSIVRVIVYILYLAVVHGLHHAQFVF